MSPAGFPGLLLPLVLAAPLVGPAALPAQPAVSLQRYEFEQPRMGTIFRIVLFAGEAPVARRASDAAFERIARLDAHLSDYRADSELNRAAREAHDRPVEVSRDLFDVLSRAQALSVRTEGAFDVTGGSITRLWRRARRLNVLPSPGELTEARAASGYGHLVLDPASRTVRLLRKGVLFDLGGIAKGYAADAALAELRRAGVPRALVSAGGDVAAGDAPPGAGGWDVDVTGWNGEATSRTRLTMVRAAVSTSGDLEQWLDAQGVRHSHIVDPRTGRALTERRLVSVIAPRATTSDMLATAVSVLGPEEGGRLIEETPGAALLMAVERNGRVTWTASGQWPVK